LVGGVAIRVGLDNGDGGGTARNGILETGEVDQTSYVCTPLTPCSGVRSGATVSATITPDIGIAATGVGVAWDGTNFWFSSGGASGGTRLVRTDQAFGNATPFVPNKDFRSLFTKGDGTTAIFASEFNSSIITRQTSPGVFATEVTRATFVSSQLAVAWDESSEEYIGRSSATLHRFDSTGAAVGTVTLASAPSGTGVAACRSGYLTYDSSGPTLRQHDKTTGAVTGTVTLTGGPSSPEALFAVAARRVWISAGTTWSVYDALL
jgi:hypothetical protein